MSESKPKFDDKAWKVKETKKKADEDKKKAKKIEFDDDADKDKNDSKSMGKRMRRVEQVTGLRA